MNDDQMFFVWSTICLLLSLLLHLSVVPSKVVLKYIEPKEPRSHAEIMSYMSDDGWGYFFQGAYISLQLWVLTKAGRIIKEYDQGVPVFSLNLEGRQD